MVAAFASLQSLNLSGLNDIQHESDIDSQSINQTTVWKYLV